MQSCVLALFKRALSWQLSASLSILAEGKVLEGQEGGAAAAHICTRAVVKLAKTVSASRHFSLAFLQSLILA